MITVSNSHFLVSLDSEEIARCLQFSEDVFESNAAKYAKRKQKDPKIIKKQIMEGKIGELAVEKLLKAFNISTTTPDFQIYQAKEKSWDADLMTEFGQVHVKSMSTAQAKRYQLSFTFQAGGWDTDKLVSEPKPNDYIALTEIDDSDYTKGIKVVGLLKADTTLTPVLLKDPVVWQLRGIKKVLYYSDVSEFDRKDLWTCLYGKYQDYKLILDMQKEGW